MAEANGLLAQPLELVRRSLLILYGTETGHSQEIAEELADMAIRLRFETSLEEMDGVELVSTLVYLANVTEEVSWRCAIVYEKKKNNH